MIRVCHGELRRVAWHEAAHACAAVSLGVELEYTSVRPNVNDDFQWLGVTVGTGDLSLYGRCMILLAGAEIERQAFGTPAELDADDLATVTEILAAEFASDPDRARRITKMRRELDALVRDGITALRPWIDRLARRLLVARVVDGAEVIRLRGDDD